MQLVFLESDVRLSKKYTQAGSTPYPNVSTFRSHIYPAITKLEHMHDLIVTHAAEGHCLLKGRLTSPLHNESRAGKTDPSEPTEWMCLDLDGLIGLTTPDQFMTAIGLPDTSYVLQWSASYGINGNFSLRAHLFVLLDQPTSPSALKAWLKQINLNTLTNELALTKTNVALKWGLDVTTCQNDKLIYIAPPTCTPPELNHFTGKRIQLVRKPQERFSFASVTLLSGEQLKAQEEAQINRLRRYQNLPERPPTKFKLKEHKGELYMPSPDQAHVTGSKTERGFVYLNLNGGDSWGYYHPEDNPTFIYNFKGEPTYRTAELVPDYWASLRVAQKQKVQAAAKVNQRLYLAFRDFRTAEYWNGSYDIAADEITIAKAKNEKQLEDYLVVHGQPAPDAIPVWTICFDPRGPMIDVTNQRVNLFRPSSYMRQSQELLTNGTISTGSLTCPQTILRVLEHVAGAEMTDHLLNWIAFLYQYRTAPRTAWIWHGIQGTGKGVLVNEVLKPVFGEGNVSIKRMEELEDKFNDYLENSLITFVDEAQISESGRNKIIMANLKNWITEPTVTIRRMRTASYEVTNNCGWIFASNKPDPVTVEASDRRFNVGEYQPAKLPMSDAIMTQLKSELQDFANYLQTRVVDVEAATTPKENEAKEQMILVSRSSADAVADALLEGDLSRLWDALPTVDATLLDTATQMRLFGYKQLMHDLVTTRRGKLTREELFTIFQYNVGNVPGSPHKLTSYLKHHGLTIRNIRSDERVCKGIVVDWSNPQPWFDERLAEIAAENGAPKLALVKKGAP